MHLFLVPSKKEMNLLCFHCSENIPSLLIWSGMGEILSKQMLCIWSVTVCISNIGAIELEKKLQRKVFHHHAGSTSHWDGSSKNHWRLVERFGMEFSFIWSRYCILRGCRFFPSRCPYYKNQKCASGKYKYFFDKLNIIWDSKHDNVSAIAFIDIHWGSI